jgi:hypothetical protein
LTENGCCITCCSGDAACCNMLQSCCDALCACCEVTCGAKALGRANSIADSLD